MRLTPTWEVAVCIGLYQLDELNLKSFFAWSGIGAQKWARRAEHVEPRLSLQFVVLSTPPG